MGIWPKVLGGIVLILTLGLVSCQALLSTLEAAAS
jgi:hypothetical protein